MNRLRLAALALVSLLPTLHAQNLDLISGGGGKKESVTAAIVSEVKAAAPGKPFRAAVKIVHEPHFHTYGKVVAAGATGLPTKLAWTLPEGWKVEELPWPATTPFESFGAKADGYEGTVHLPVRITPAPGAAAGSQAELQVAVSGLVCDDKTCLPFTTKATLSLPLAASAEIDTAHSSVFPAEAATAPETKPIEKKNDAVIKEAPMGLGGLLLYALLGGLILNVMPCVFPVLGIKITSVVQQAGEDRRKVVLHGLIYTLGILICFWIMGGLAIALNKGWGSQLQSPAFNFGLAAFFLVFAMNMAGVFEIGASAVGVGSNLQQKGGLAGSFFSGLLAVIVATPCSAPFLGTALGATLALPPAQSMLIFTCIGIGLASPFLLLSIAPGLVSALPRPGAWMESFKQGMSFLLFGTVGFMIFVLSSQIEGLPLLIAMLSLVLIGFGFWIYGRWALPHKPARTILIARLLTLAAVAAGLWFGLPGAGAAKAKSDGKTVSNDPDALTWDSWSADKVAALRAAKVPVYIDYTASWCWTCQVNKRVYSDAALRELFRKHKVATLKADWSDVNDTIRDALAALGKRAVPVNVLYLPGADDPIILPELLTVENVSEALNKIAK